MWLLLFAFAFVGANLSVQADDSLSVLRNVPYLHREGVDVVYNSLDLYFPTHWENAPVESPDETGAIPEYPRQEGNTPEKSESHSAWDFSAHLRPIVVYVHGGAWKRGSKNQVDFKPAFFLRHGFVFASVNYRLSPREDADSLTQANGWRHPAHVLDVCAAIAWLRIHAADYGGDGNNMHLMGHSAGGQIALVAATHPRYLAEAGCPPRVIRSVTALDPGVIDIRTAVRLASPKIKAMYANAFGSPPEKQWDASPLHQLALGRNDIPVRFLAVREMSRLQAYVYADSLRELGGWAEVEWVPGKDHNTLNRDFGATNDAIGHEIALATVGFMRDAQRPHRSPFSVPVSRSYSTPGKPKSDAHDLAKAGVTLPLPTMSEESDADMPDIAELESAPADVSGAENTLLKTQNRAPAKPH